MTHRFVLAFILLAVFAATGPGSAAGQPLPVKNGRPAVAVVNDEPISLDELVMELDPGRDHTRLREGIATAHELELLERLVNVRLVVQESASMGLSEQPELQRQVEVTARTILRDVLFEHVVKDVKADPTVVEQKFRDLAREWKTTSLLFTEEAAATRAREELAGGAAFDDVAARAVAARKSADDAYHPKKDYLPPVAEVLATLKRGQVSPVIPIQAGFVVVVVNDVRYPESAEIRAAAEEEALRQQQLVALQAHEEAVRQEHAVVHEAVLDAVDYEAEKPGVDALLKDQRVVADIKGAPPITVGDLTEYLRMQSFHGPDQSGQRKRMNGTKKAAFEAMLSRRLLNAEAVRLGLDKSNEYLDRVKAYENGLVFDTFVQKVIVPDSKVTDEEVKGYYDGHLAEFSSPEMMRIRSLAFTGRAAAEAAVLRLREGADYGWLVANAEGQADKAAPGLLALDGRPVTTDSMPEGVRDAVAGAKAGDVRLYASPEGPFYVLAVQAVIAANPRPYEEVRDDLAKKVYGEKLQKNVEEYLGKLRAASTIEICVKRAQ